MTSRHPLDKSLPKLTAKQREVLALVADNRTSKEIAGLLGISESAVNQRIEIVRSRLGGLPRGELARLYRQNFSTGEDQFSRTWQKIHLPGGTFRGNGSAAESIQTGGTDRSQASGESGADGSQLSAPFLPADSPWLASEQGSMALARALAIAAIVLAALLIATAVTYLLGPGGGEAV